MQKLHRSKAGRRMLKMKGDKQEKASSKLQLQGEKNHEQKKFCVKDRENEI